MFTREEYAQSRGGGSPRTVDSLLRKHVQGGRIARVRRGLYVSVPAGGAAETVDPYLVATKAVGMSATPLSSEKPLSARYSLSSPELRVS